MYYIEIDATRTIYLYLNKKTKEKYKKTISEIRDKKFIYEKLFYKGNLIVKIRFTNKNITLLTHIKKLNIFRQIELTYEKAYEYFNKKYHNYNNVKEEVVYLDLNNFHNLSNNQKAYVLDLFSDNEYLNFDIGEHLRICPSLFLKFKNQTNLDYGNRDLYTHSLLLDNFQKNSEEKLSYDYDTFRDTLYMNKEKYIKEYAFGHIMCLDKNIIYDEDTNFSFVENVVYWEIDTMKVKNIDDFIETLKKDDKEHFFIYEDEVVCGIKDIKKVLRYFKHLVR